MSSITDMERLDRILETTKLPFELAELQLSDVEDAIIAERYGWFLEVGCGKTVCSTLTSLAWNNQHTIVTCPPILNHEWRKWLEGIGQKDVSVFEGSKRTIDMLDHRWVIMSHAIYRDSFKFIMPFYKGRRLDLIVDEAQAIKNPKSKLFQYVKMLLGPDRGAQMLSGTPTSKPEDTYTYMAVKTPGLYKSWGHWEGMHVESRDFWGTIEAYKNIDLLRENFALKSTTRTKKEVFGHDLMPAFREMPYKLDKAHYKLYEKLAEEQLLLLPDGSKIDAASAQRLRHALQQIVCNYARFSGNPENRSAAYDILDQTIDEVNPMVPSHSKLCIWTYYKATSAGVYDYLATKFGSEAVAAAYSDTDSRKAVDRIMHDPKCRILVAQPSSVGVGLNLQHVCWEMLFLEMATTSIPIKQALGRVDRVGQLTKPTIRFAQALDTIQPYLYQNLLSNDDLVAKVENGVISLREQIYGIV